MSTRGAWGFRIGRKDKITYQHSDSYPEWLGKSIVEFIKSVEPSNPSKLAEIGTALECVNPDKQPTKAQIAKIQKDFPEAIDLSVSGRKLTDWYCLLRGAQGNFEMYKKGFPYLYENKAFLYNSLFCEHAYIINLDEGVLEYYLGFNRNTKAPGRYAKKSEKGEEFKGVALLATYTFQQLIDTPADVIVADMLDKAALLEAIQTV